ncbi:uncharacterized protein Ecym_4005 [Eremothecium cymbalariae DBVPG|uniref:Suppressor of lethality of KEX2 GAS1 double null mutant protein 1 n=1 Tax=Eremothecium cymbalariae (strain CBS 270.75 / DBVPG 7215 / KCTC 17166 / NRRL Y-17582) TaxID=931890 RepID=G8JST6_ERECY|nr:hypothetical protein Ecym_4005 [Eremothecium cymbalariae DBVPG\
MVDATTVAVSFAVGLPVGLALIIAFGFWVKTQRRFKQEEKDEEEHGSLHDEELSFMEANVPARKLAEGQGCVKDAPEVFGEGRGGGRVVGGSASEESTSNDEKLDTPDTDSSGRQQKASGGAKRSNTKYYTPAYRRKINASLLQSTSRQPDEVSATNSSAASLDTERVQRSAFEQIVPVMCAESGTMLAAPDISVFSDKHSRNSSENLIRSLNNQDFGSYPKRRPSGTNINGLAVSSASLYSSNSRLPSSSTLNRLPHDENFGPFETPLSMKTSRDIYGVDGTAIKPDIYMLKNNYDVTNSEEITEEDQYENEFTNYSENKREFIASLRPKNTRTCT